MQGVKSEVLENLRKLQKNEEYANKVFFVRNLGA